MKFIADREKEMMDRKPEPTSIQSLYIVISQGLDSGSSSLDLGASTRAYLSSNWSNLVEELKKLSPFEMSRTATLPIRFC